MEGTIYLISDGTFFKIGRTKKNIDKRLKELQTGNSSDLQVIYTAQVKNAPTVEATLHRRYKYCQQINEWFDLTAENIKTFVNDCKLIDNNLELLKKSQDKI